MRAWHLPQQSHFDSGAGDYLLSLATPASSGLGAVAACQQVEPRRRRGGPDRLFGFVGCGAADSVGGGDAFVH
jgi:hypothetical protein